MSDQDRKFSDYREEFRAFDQLSTGELVAVFSVSANLDGQPVSSIIAYDEASLGAKVKLMEQQVESGFQRDEEQVQELRERVPEMLPEIKAVLTAMKAQP